MEAKINKVSQSKVNEFLSFSALGKDRAGSTYSGQLLLCIRVINCYLSIMALICQLPDAFYKLPDLSTENLQDVLAQNAEEVERNSCSVAVNELKAHGKQIKCFNSSMYILLKREVEQP